MWPLRDESGPIADVKEFRLFVLVRGQLLINGRIASRFCS